MNELCLEIKEIVLSDLTKEEMLYKLSDYHDSDIADALEDLTEEERLKVYSLLGVEKVSEIFAYYENVEEYIEEVSPDLAADIIQEMDSNDAFDVLNELDDEEKDEIIRLMEDESKEKVLALDKYNEDEIGSYMSDNFIVVSSSDTIASATKTIIKMAKEHDNIFTVYVVDENNKYFGAIDFKDLIIARKTDTLLDIIMTSYPSFYDTELMFECINKLKDYSEDSIPVLNKDDEIVGVITSDILIDVTEEEIAEDYAKLGGLNDVEDIDESIFMSVKKRIPWLVVLLFLGLMVSNVTGAFEGVIATIPALVFFQTVILGMSGNGGTQSLAVTIRNISNGESKNKLAKNIIKEICVGVCNGLIVAFISFLFVVAFLYLKKQEINIGEGYQFEASIKVASIISGSLLIAMTISNLIGTTFPILLHKMHIDPAVASGPFITTVNDVVSIVIYYGLAMIFL